jgi:hypothetical protein
MAIFHHFKELEQIPEPPAERSGGGDYSLHQNYVKI